jgi:hypothetical protein
VNRRGRRETLAEGERVVVWAPGATTPASSPDATAALAKRDGLVPEPTPPLAAPPFPDLLPALP